MLPTTTREEANDYDHETLDQVTARPRRSTRTRSAPEWYGNPVLEVMLLDHGEPTNYEQAMMSPDSYRWLEAMKSVGILGTGVPRLACLRPTALLCERARTTHLHQQRLKTLARGQATRGRSHKIKARQTS